MPADDLAPLLAELRRTAVERDKRGGHPAEEKALLQAAGLLRLSIPAQLGGDERPWPEIFALVRRVATVDSALAHLLAFHHLQVATLRIYGNAAQQQHWFGRTIAEGGWWGNAVNPLDAGLTASAQPDGYLLDGRKGFCSGTRGSRFMTLTARLADGSSVMGVIETDHPGIVVHDDWDPIGQRQTDSGSVSFRQVLLRRTDVLRAHDAVPSAFHTLRNSFGQLILANLFVGIAIGARDEARDFARTQARPWVASGVQRATEDPYTLQRFGEIHVQIAAAEALTDRAATAIQVAFERGPALNERERAETAVAIAEAKVIAHRAGLFASQELFDVIGARGTRASLGYDRFWRNVRTHTLHDPIDYKLAMLGRWALNDEFPPPNMYT
ncbi:MAG: acyl-CoA dehydrogenase family protein [Proteobacteria bacterium]|nr:acyl-CoA dehydrogenase family protein [Pseudomonadota bacterium]